MANVVAGLYAALVLALIAAAVSIWRLHCESFGCMGVGIAWITWVVGFFVVLGVGLFARVTVASAAGLAGVCRAAWWIQLMAGAVLAAVWVGKNVV